MIGFQRHVQEGRGVLSGAKALTLSLAQLWKHEVIRKKNHELRANQPPSERPVQATELADLNKNNFQKQKYLGDIAGLIRDYSKKTSRTERLVSRCI